jgi:O-methyltransferase domain/Dimerisation domain
VTADATPPQAAPQGDGPPASPHATLGQLLRGGLVTQLIHVAARLGIADLLRAGPKSADDLAAAVGVNAQALHRVLRALAGLGIFAETDPGCFALTPLADPLRSDAPASLRGSAVFYGEPWWWQACGDLLYSVRTGQPAFDHVHGQPLFAFLDATADAAAIFNEHQTNMTRQDAAAVVDAYDFTGCTTVVDVGGGHGALAAAILRASPRTTAVLFDRPAVVEGAGRRLRAEGVAERCSCVGGDFFESVPAGADTYVLKDIIHDWDDERAASILRQCRRAMTHSAATPRLLLIEKVIPPGNAPFAGKLTDITMLLIAVGRERTAEEYRALLTAAGFDVRRIVPTRSPASVIEAIPA